MSFPCRVILPSIAIYYTKPLISVTYSWLSAYLAVFQCTNLMCLFVFQSICLVVCLFCSQFPRLRGFGLSLWLSVYLSLCLLPCLPAFVSLCLVVCLYIWLTRWLSNCLFCWLLVCFSVDQWIHGFMYLCSHWVNRRDGKHMIEHSHRGMQNLL